MFPPKGSGLEQIIRMLESRYPGFSLGKPFQSAFGNYCTKNQAGIRPINIPNPVQSLHQLQNALQNIVGGLSYNLNYALSQITGSASREDYTELVRGFIPYGAKLIRPQFPENSGEVMLADIDGDSRKELIASYKHDDSVIRTIILKKKSGEWDRLYEIEHPGYESIHYRNIANITGSGKYQLVLGLAGQGKEKTLHGYDIDADGVKNLFAKNYHKLEPLGLPGQRTTLSRTQFALWYENDDDTYDIDVTEWDGIELASVDTKRYYNKKIIPVYIWQLKQNPYRPANWYRLADALAKAGAREEAEEVIAAGMKRDKSSEYKEKFQALRNRL